jgi:cell wall-associated NlpC family hydrolase
VAADDLQPGDLVFYYSPISHVGMYIGNGMIVHAANPGAGVRVAGLYSMPYVGAVRPG